jgi:Zn-dependent M16 (insulinase) family peptidase
MKGSYSSPDDLLTEFSQRSLFPDTVYGLDSGGDPQHIPDLTYADFKAFHQRYYHPNAPLFFFGDDDPIERFASARFVASNSENRVIALISLKITVLRDIACLI